jgi:hypothetical protein
MPAAAAKHQLQHQHTHVESLLALSPSLTQLNLVAVTPLSGPSPAPNRKKYSPVF